MAEKIWGNVRNVKRGCSKGAKERLAASSEFENKNDGEQLRHAWTLQESAESVRVRHAWKISGGRVQGRKAHQVENCSGRTPRTAPPAHARQRALSTARSGRPLGRSPKRRNREQKNLCDSRDASEPCLHACWGEKIPTLATISRKETEANFPLCLRARRRYNCTAKKLFS
jgi:hypothetical protein